MENDNKEQLFNGLWIKLQKAMRGHNGIDFIARSDIENGTAEMSNDYLRKNEKIVTKALKDDATKEDDKELTEHLNKIGTNIFRYKFIEEDENGVVNEYRFSFEEDKMIVNIRDNNNKLNTIEFEYKVHSEKLINNIIADLIFNNKNSIFFEKNKYNSSIANTVLKYCFKNIINDFGESFVPYFEKNCFIVSDTLIRTSLEIGDINLFNYCLNKSYITEEKLTRRLINLIINALTSDSTEIIAKFESELEKNKNILDFLQVACTNKNIGIDLILYLFNNYRGCYSEDDLIELFGYVYDPRAAKMVFYELLNIGCDIYDIDNNNYCSTVLCSIAGSGNIEVMQYILGEISKTLTERQINNIINKSYMEETVLNEAIKHNNIDMVRFLLLRSGINVNVRNEYGETPLYYAIEKENIEIIKLLLNYEEIDVNAEDEDRETPLLYAVRKDNIEIIRFLLTNKNININKPNGFGCTPLHRAVKNGNNEIVKLLLTDSSIDVNKVDENNISPLYLAVQLGNVEIIKLLLANEKIDVNKANAVNVGLLHKAIMGGNIEIIRLLLTNEKIDIDAVNIFGESPLYLASALKNTEIIKLLFVVKPNIDINEKKYSLFNNNFSLLENCMFYHDFDNKSKKMFMCLLNAKAYYINENIKNIKDKQKEISKQIEILEDMKNRYTSRKIFIEEAIEEFKVYFNYNKIKEK